MSVRVDLDMNGFAALKAHVLSQVEAIPLAVGVDAEAAAPVDTGALKLSVAVDRLAEDVWTISAWGGAGGRHYAAYVELGTRYMRAQPFLRPACYVYRTDARGAGGKFRKVTL
jgi:HK97 gp10 family phage protein